MRAGIIGLVDGEFGNIPSFMDEMLRDDIELARGVEVIDDYTLDTGDYAVEGRAAKEELDSVDVVNISKNGISWGEETEPVSVKTKFAAVPGKFVLTENGAGTFAYDLIGSKCDAVIQRAELDLDSLLLEHDEDTVWQLGFYGSGENAEKGVIYGDEVLEDRQIGDLLSLSNKNQLGLEFDFRGDLIRMTATESGYVEVYQPTSYETDDFLNFFIEEVWPHVTRREI